MCTLKSVGICLSISSLVDSRLFCQSECIHTWTWEWLYRSFLATIMFPRVCNPRKSNSNCVYRVTVLFYGHIRYRISSFWRKDRGKDRSDRKTRKKTSEATGWPSRKERILEIESGSTGSHSMEKSLWQILCRKTDNRTNERVNNKHSGAFKSGTYHFLKCDKFGNRESHFYQDGALSIDADTKNTSEVGAMTSIRACAIFVKYIH
jgi:hypothetical protein